MIVSRDLWMFGSIVFVPVTLGVHSTAFSDRKLRSGDKSLGRAWLAIGIAYFCFAMAGSVLAVGSVVFFRLKTDHDEASWPSIEAVVTDVQLVSSVGRHSAVLWSPIWTYTYTLGGRPYVTRSTEFSLPSATDKYRSKDAAMNAAISQPAGSIVTTYYDPENPQRSVLTLPEWAPIDWAITAYWLTAIAFSISGYRVFVRMWQQRALAH